MDFIGKGLVFFYLLERRRIINFPKFLPAMNDSIDGLFEAFENSHVKYLEDNFFQWQKRGRGVGYSLKDSFIGSDNKSGHVLYEKEHSEHSKLFIFNIISQYEAEYRFAEVNKLQRDEFLNHFYKSIYKPFIDKVKSTPPALITPSLAYGGYALGAALHSTELGVMLGSMGFTIGAIISLPLVGTSWGKSSRKRAEQLQDYCADNNITYLKGIEALRALAE